MYWDLSDMAIHCCANIPSMLQQRKLLFSFYCDSETQFHVIGISLNHSYLAERLITHFCELWTHFKIKFPHYPSLCRCRVYSRHSSSKIKKMNVPNVLVWVWMLLDWNKVACTSFNPWKTCVSKFSSNLTNQSLACHNGIQSQYSPRNMRLDWPNDILHVINVLLDTIYCYRELFWETDTHFTRPRVVAFP